MPMFFFKLLSLVVKDIKSVNSDGTVEMKNKGEK